MAQLNITLNQGTSSRCADGAPLTAPSRVIVDRHGCIRIPCTTCAWEKYFTHKLGLDCQFRTFVQFCS